MNKHRRPWRTNALAALLLLAGAGSTLAADAPAALDLRQLIALAQRDNKELQAARYAIDIGQARLLQAGLRDNPTLDLSTKTDVLFGNDGEYGHAIAISQSFPIAGRLLRQKDVARVDVALAEAEVAEAERRLAGEVASDAYRWLVLDRQIAARTRLIDVEATLLRTTQERFKAAEVSELDVNTVRLDRERLIQERALLVNQRETVHVALNTRLGRPASAALTVSEPIPTGIALPS